MKRIILLMNVLLIAGLCFAQTAKQTDFNKLAKKVESSKADIENPKKNTAPKTWITRGDIMAEVHESMLLNARSGMNANEFKIVVGQPQEILNKVVDENDYEVFVFDRIKFNFINNELESWEITNPVVEKPLFLAMEAYLKAKSIDDKGKSDKVLKEKLTALKYLFINEASNFYALKNYNDAYENFVKSIELGENPLVNYVDTLVLYYGGLSAQLAGRLEEAISMYNKSIQYGFTSEGGIYYNIYEAYTGLEKPEEGVRFLEEGFTKFPNNQNVLYSLINFYINRGEDPSKVLVYLKKAQEQDPNEPSLYFAEGILYDKLEKPEDAADSYKKALEIKPDFFDAAYNLGAIYYNIGVKFIEEANKVPARETEKYDALWAKANDYFKKCIPFIERAHEIDPKDRNSLETLKNLYFRYRNENEEYAKKLEAVNEKLNQL